MIRICLASGVDGVCFFCAELCYGELFFKCFTHFIVFVYSLYGIIVIVAVGDVAVVAISVVNVAIVVTLTDLWLLVKEVHTYTHAMYVCVFQFAAHFASRSVVCGMLLLYA